MVLIPQGFGRVGRCRGIFSPKKKRNCLNLGIRKFAVLFAILLLPSFVHARDFGFTVPSIHAGKLASSVLYEHLKVREDFDTRGSADFRSDVVGSQFTYAVTDQLALGFKGGALVDPRVNAQGTEWQSRAGYLYGFDL